MKMVKKKVVIQLIFFIFSLEIGILGISNQANAQVSGTLSVNPTTVAPNQSFHIDITGQDPAGGLYLKVNLDFPAYAYHYEIDSSYVAGTSVGMGTSWSDFRAGDYYVCGYVYPNGVGVPTTPDCITVHILCQCADGTNCNQCMAGNPPFYCDAGGNLVNSCSAPSFCGCPVTLPNCQVDGSCAAALPVEICDNNVDDDGDTWIDCQDQLDCPIGTACGPGKTCDASGNCVAPGPVVEICDNNVDDDGDTLIDCQDQLDCPTGTACAPGKTCDVAGNCVVAGPACNNVDGDTYDDCAIGSPGDDGKSIDCDDSNSAIHPGAVETCGNGIDEDCSGADLPCAACPDNDGDGYEAQACGGSDCNDSNSAIHPGAAEVCNDGTDNNCDGLKDCKDSVNCPEGTPCGPEKVCDPAGDCRIERTPPPGGGWNTYSNGVTVAYQGLVPCGKNVCLDPDMDGDEVRLDAEDKPNCKGGYPYVACQFCHFFVMFKGIIDFILFRIVPIVAVLLLVIGGAIFIFSAGSPEKVGQGQSILTAVVIGLIIIFAAWLVLNLFFTLIGVEDWTGLREGWFQINCSIRI